MAIKTFGIIFVLFSCSSVGFKIANNYKKEELNLKTLIHIIDFISAELQYRLTSLPEIFHTVSKLFPDALGQLFAEIALMMNNHNLENTLMCMNAVLTRNKNLTPITLKQMELMSKSLGKFDKEGQLKELEAIRKECERSLDYLKANQDTRIRSYQTLGLCAGAALAILFV